MRNAIFMVLILSVVSGTTTAQPQNGDLVYSIPGFTAYFSPTKPGTITTLAVAPGKLIHSGTRMAPNNKDVMVSESNINASPCTSDLVSLLVGGGKKTISFGGGAQNFKLDHDNKWIAAEFDRNGTQNINFLFGVDHGTGVVTTYWTVPRTNTNRFGASAIDRDPGSPFPHLIALNGTSTPYIMRADRKGATTVVANSSPTPYFTCVEVHPRSGDYILGSWGFGGLTRMTKSGAQKVIVPGYDVNAIKITQDDFAWCAVQTSTTAPPTALKVDLSKNAVVTLVQTGLTAGLPMGIEVYGSRSLRCCQLPATPRTVAVTVKSQHRFAGDADYFLAASLARRPGIRFPNGEWLDLNADPLFYLSAMNVLPGTFANFQGKLDAFSKATATVNIPSSVPMNNNTTVFVAGVIVKNGQVIQVTNSHWFVL